MSSDSLSIYGTPEWGQIIWPLVNITPSNDMVHVAKSSLHGIGCFAKTNIAAGTVLSCSPVVFIWGDDEMDAVASTGLGGYPFTWGECVGNDGVEPLYCFSLGVGAIYNHSNDPNCRYEMVEAGEDFHGRSFVCPVLLHIAQRDVRRGEELTTDYSDGDPSTLWFTPTKEGDHG